MARPDPPEQVIRRWLDGHGGTVTVDVAALSRTWERDKLPRTERERIEGLLAGAGVRCAPPLRHRVEGQQITLFVRKGAGPGGGQAVADPGAPDPYAGAMPVADPAPEPAPEPEPEPAPEPEPPPEPEPLPEPEPASPPERLNLRRRPPVPAPVPIEPEPPADEPEAPEADVEPPSRIGRLSLRRRAPVDPEPVQPEAVEPQAETVAPEPPTPEPEPQPGTQVAPPEEPRRLSLRRPPPGAPPPEPEPEPQPQPDTQLAPPEEPRRLSLRRPPPVAPSQAPEPAAAVPQVATAPAAPSEPERAPTSAQAAVAVDDGFAPTEPVDKAAFYGVIAGIVAMLIGSLGPWSKAFVATSYGIDGAGLLVLGAGVTCFAGLALAREHRRVEPLFFMAAAAAASAGVAGSDLHDYVADAAVGPAWGVWLAVLGSIVVALSALVLIVRRDPEP